MNYQEFIESYSNTTSLYSMTPPQLTKALKNCRMNWALRNNGRTFTNVCNALYYTTSNLDTLFKLIHYITGKEVYIDTQYKTFTTDTAPQAIEEIVSTSRRWGMQNDRVYKRLIIAHIPRGTTFITDTLNEAVENKEVTRLKNIEVQLINNPTHYLKILKHNNTETETYSIITNWVDKDFIHKILLLCPIIFGLPYHEPAEIEQAKENHTQYVLDNTIINLFATLYEYFNGKSDKDTALEKIMLYYNAIIEVKELNQINIETFTAKLANAVNNKINKTIQSNYNSAKSNIEHYERQLAEQYAKLAVYERQLAFGNTAQPDDVSAFTEMLTKTKAITVIDTDDNKIKLAVTAPLQFFTTSDFEAYERSKKSYYNNLRYGADPKYTKPIFHKIFVTHEYKILLSAVIELTANDDSYSEQALSVHALGHQQYTKDNCYSIPNAHLYYHDCWSRTKERIMKAVANKEYDLIPTLIVNSVQTVNIAETTTFYKFLDNIAESSWRNKIKLITKDNKEITWADAIDIEKENYKTMTEPIEETPKEEIKIEDKTESTTGGYTQVVVEEELPF